MAQLFQAALWLSKTAREKADADAGTAKRAAKQSAGNDQIAETRLMQAKRWIEDGDPEIVERRLRDLLRLYRRLKVCGGGKEGTKKGAL